MFCFLCCPLSSFLIFFAFFCVYRSLLNTCLPFSFSNFLFKLEITRLLTQFFLVKAFLGLGKVRTFTFSRVSWNIDIQSKSHDLFRGSYRMPTVVERQRKYLKLWVLNITDNVLPIFLYLLKVIRKFESIGIFSVWEKMIVNIVVAEV